MKSHALSHLFNLKPKGKTISSTIRCLWQKEMCSIWNQFLPLYKFSSAGINLSSQESYTSCHRKNCPVIGRNFLTQEDISCQRKKFAAIRTNFLAKKEMYCHRKIFLLHQGWNSFDSTKEHGGVGGEWHLEREQTRVHFLRVKHWTGWKRSHLD